MEREPWEVWYEPVSAGMLAVVLFCRGSSQLLVQAVDGAQGQVFMSKMGVPDLPHALSSRYDQSLLAVAQAIRKGEATLSWNQENQQISLRVDLPHIRSPPRLRLPTALYLASPLAPEAARIA